MIRKIKLGVYTIYVAIMWQVGRIRKPAASPDKPVHLFFSMTDHYEPGTSGVDCEIEMAIVDELLERYPKISAKHRDADGRKPTRTWFFPPHYHRYGSLKKLVKLCAQGYGEIELHLHHGKHKPDTAEHLADTLKQVVSEYSEFGIFGEVDGVKRYGFIHGDWALANSRKNDYCGVNDEIRVLRETGCYADFTHPSRPTTTPRQINTIHYAKSSAVHPKSYNRGVLAQADKQGDDSDQLLLIQGPLYPLKTRKGITSYRPVGDEISGKPYTTKERVKRWVETAIQVANKPDWVFIKTHTHGAAHGEFALGQEFEDILNELETHYNDGKKYVLHYVTAREMYNLVKAAEDGKGEEDPASLFDYRVSRPVYNLKCNNHKASDTLDAMVYDTYRG